MPKLLLCFIYIALFLNYYQFIFSKNQFFDYFLEWSYEEIEKISDEDISQATSSGLSRLASVRNNKTPTNYIPGHYKYVIVPNGMNGGSTSSRLLSVLGYCDCVVMLVNSHLQFHISIRLKPWVHYVPLSSNGADVVAKV